MVHFEADNAQGGLLSEWQIARNDFVCFHYKCYVLGYNWTIYNFVLRSLIYRKKRFYNV